MIPERVAHALLTAARPVCAYVYDTGAPRDRAAEVRAALPGTARLVYDMRANGHPAVLAALLSTVDGVRVGSTAELAAATAAGARRISFGGPAKSDADLTAAVLARASVQIGSLLELRRLALVAAGSRVSVSLHVARGGAGRAAAGLHELRLAEAVKLAASVPGLRLTGPRLRAPDGDTRALARFVHEAQAWAAGCTDWQAATGLPPRRLTVSGGFGPPGTPVDLAILRNGLAGLSGRPRLAFEIGGYLVAGAGWYAAEVLDLRCAGGHWQAVLPGGTRRAGGAGSPGGYLVLPVDRWDYPFARPEITGVTAEPVGTPGGVPAAARRVARLRVGDVLVFPDAAGHRRADPYPETIVF